MLPTEYGHKRYLSIDRKNCPGLVVGVSTEVSKYTAYSKSTPACLVYSGVVGVVQLHAREPTSARQHLSGVTMCNNDRDGCRSARARKPMTLLQRPCTRQYTFCTWGIICLLHTYDRVYNILPIIVVGDFSWDVPTCQFLQDGVMGPLYGRQPSLVGEAKLFGPGTSLYVQPQYMLHDLPHAPYNYLLLLYVHSRFTQPTPLLRSQSQTPRRGGEGGYSSCVRF